MRSSMAVSSRDSRVRQLVLHIPHQQPGSLQIATDAMTDPVDQPFHLRRCWRLHPAKKYIALRRDVHAIQKQHVKVNIGDDVIDEDLVLVWECEVRRIITGADLLGRLLRGIARPAPRAQGLRG